MALLGGLLFPLAFSPFGFSFFSILALSLLFLAWLDARTPSHAFAYGYVFGMGQFGFGTSWIYHSIHDYGGASVAEASSLTVLFCLVLSCYPACAGWCAVRAWGNRRSFCTVLIAFPSMWVIFEWVRSWFPTGFPWLQLGYAYLDTLMGKVLAPLFGVYGISATAALLAGVSTLVLRWTSHEQFRHPLYWVGATVLFSITLPAHSVHIEWTQSAGSPFLATLLQGNISQDQKWRPGALSSTLAQYHDMTREHWSSKLIVWPETAIPAFYHQIKQVFLEPLSQEASLHGTELLIGIPFQKENAPQTYYNAVLKLGDTSTFYFKRHLVPFGEYVPWKPLLGWILEKLDMPLSDFTAGETRFPLLVAAGYPLAASVCYEDVFGEESLSGLPEAAYLVNVTNDAWFGDSIAPHQHLQMARMRALETGRWMIRATNTGVTAIIDDKGGVVKQAPLFEKTSVTGYITPMQGSTPYLIWGDRPAIIVIFLPLGYLLWKKIYQKYLFHLSVKR